MRIGINIENFLLNFNEILLNDYINDKLYKDLFSKLGDIK